jgi:hypothetical protein
MIIDRFLEYLMTLFKLEYSYKVDIRKDDHEQGVRIWKKPIEAC